MIENTHPSAVAPALGIFIILISLVIGVVVLLFFILSLRKTMLLVPKEKHRFPSWFLWMFFIPYAGYIFMWIMLPFGLPTTLRRHLGDGNPGEYSPGRSLFKVGLSYMIIGTVYAFIAIFFQAMSPFHKLLTHHAGHVSSENGAMGIMLLFFALVSVAQIVLWIVYWVKAVGARKYLRQQSSLLNSQV